MKGILFRSTYTASLNITYAESVDEAAADKEISEHVAKVLLLFKIDNVSIDKGFCCNELTEIGLIGNKARCVQEAAELIMKFVEESSSFQSVDV